MIRGVHELRLLTLLPTSAKLVATTANTELASFVERDVAGLHGGIVQGWARLCLHRTHPLCTISRLYSPTPPPSLANDTSTQYSV